MLDNEPETQSSTDKQPTTALADCTAFQIDALLELAAEPKQNGTSIKTALERRHGEVNHGRLYPNLDSLVNRGLVSKGERDGRTNEYDLTEHGKGALRAYAAYVSRCAERGER